MPKHDGGGPAFPLWHHGVADGREWPCPGMTLFEHYAGQVMGGYAANMEWLRAAKPISKQIGLPPEEILARAAGDQAAAMIAEIRRREADKETNDEDEQS